MAGTLLKHIPGCPRAAHNTHQEAAPKSSCFILKITASPQVSCPVPLSVSTAVLRQQVKPHSTCDGSGEITSFLFTNELC